MLLYQRFDTELCVQVSMQQISEGELKTCAYYWSPGKRGREVEELSWHADIINNTLF